MGELEREAEAKKSPGTDRDWGFGGSGATRDALRRIGEVPGRVVVDLLC